MVQPIRDDDHKILGGTTSTLIGCIYATTAMLPSENPDTSNRHESIESTAIHKLPWSKIQTHTYVPSQRIYTQMKLFDNHTIALYN